MGTAVKTEKPAKATKKNVIPLEVEEAGTEVTSSKKPEKESTAAKKRIAAIKEVLMMELPKDKQDREHLDKHCADMGFNDFFHVRRLVNLEMAQGFVYSKKYNDALVSLNESLEEANRSDLAVKLSKRDRSPRTKNPINSRTAVKLVNGETVEINGEKWKLVKA